MVALLTPHVVRGHLPLPESLSQSVVLFFDFLLAFLFFGVYFRDMDKLRKAAVTTESRLSDSFRYIGKANVTIELFSEFMRVPQLGLGTASDRLVVQGLLRKLFVSVLKSRGGMLRVVDRTSLRSITEFSVPTGGVPEPLLLPNSVLRWEEGEEILHTEGRTILRSVLPSQNLACILICRATCSKDDFRLAVILLNQIHLLILVSVRSCAIRDSSLVTSVAPESPT